MRPFDAKTKIGAEWAKRELGQLFSYGVYALMDRSLGPKFFYLCNITGSSRGAIHKWRVKRGLR